MNKFSFLSLEQIALQKVITDLFNTSPIKNEIIIFCKQINEFTSEEDVIKFRKQFANILDKLKLPTLMKRKLLKLIVPMLSQMLKWILYHKYELHIPLKFNEHFLCVFQWTPYCVIDQKKTAEMLIKIGNLTFIKRYIIACIYCLENSVKTLWNAFSEEEKVECLVNKTRKRELVYFWSSSISKVKTYANLFQGSIWQIKAVVSCLSVTALAFLWSHFSFSQKDEILNDSEKLVFMLTGIDYQDDDIPWYCRDNYADILCFFLLQMNDKQKLQFLQDDIRINEQTSVIYLLNWKHQDLFAKTIKKMWEFLPRKDYALILKTMVELAIILDNDYCDYLREFWNESPEYFKNHVADEFIDDSLYEILLERKFSSETIINIILILKDILQKENYIFYYYSNLKYHFHVLLKQHKLELIGSCLDSFIPFKTGVAKFKKELITSLEDGSWFKSLVIHKSWKEVENIINWCLKLENDISSFVGVEGSHCKLVLDDLKFDIVEHLICWCIMPLDENVLMNEKKDPEKNCHDAINKSQKSFESLDKILTLCFPFDEKIEAIRECLIFSLIKRNDFCTAIYAGNCELIENFINWAITIKNRNKFKWDLISAMINNQKILVHILNDYNNGFIKWCFLTEQKILVEPTELAQCLNKSQVLLKLTDKKKIENFENFFKVFMKEESCIANLKQNIFTLNNAVILFKNLIFEEAFELANYLISWALPENQIYRFKLDLIHSLLTDSNFKKHICESDSKFLEKFITWRFLSAADFKKYKENFIHSLQKDIELKSLLYDKKFDNINTLIKWSLSSVVEIDHFKEELAYFIIKSYRHNIIYKKSFLEAEEFVRFCIYIQKDFHMTNVKLIFCKIYEKYNNLFNSDNYNQILCFLLWCFDFDMSIFENNSREHLSAKDCYCQDVIIERIQKFKDWWSDRKANYITFHHLIIYMKEAFIFKQYFDNPKWFHRFISWCSLSVEKNIDVYQECTVSSLWFSPLNDICNLKNYSLNIVDATAFNNYKRNILFSRIHDYEFRSLMYRGNFNILSELINNSLVLEDDVHTFKKLLLYSTKKDGEIRNFIYEDKLEVIDTYINFCLLTKDEISQFKKELFFTLQKYNQFREFIVNLNLLKQFTDWCFVPLDEKVKHKKELFYHLIKIHEFSNLVYKGQFDIVLSFIKWAASERDSNIFLKDLLYCMKDCDRFKDLLYKKHFSNMEKIISFCLKSEENIALFKREFLYSVIKDQDFYKLIYGCDVKTIDSFLNWGMTSYEEKTNFKKQMIYFLLISKDLFKNED